MDFLFHLNYQTKQYPGVSLCHVEENKYLTITMTYKLIKDEKSIISYQDLTKTSGHGEKPEFNNEISTQGNSYRRPRLYIHKTHFQFHCFRYIRNLFHEISLVWCSVTCTTGCIWPPEFFLLDLK